MSDELLLLSGGLYGEPAPSRDWRFRDLGYLADEFTFTRASDATYRDSAGVRQTAATDEPRFDHDANGIPLGLLIEEARTNQLFNSTAPVTQTTGSLDTGTYTIWPEGAGSVEPTGNTATITGGAPATEGSPNTFVVTVAGTVDVTVTGVLTAFQLELGAFPTSLIVTAGATGTRAADLASLTTMTPWFNAAQGTLFAEALYPVTTAASACATFSINNGTNDNAINLSRTQSTNVLRGAVRTAAATVAGLDSAGTAASAVARSALAYKLNDFAFSAFGEAAQVDTGGAVPTGLDRVEIGGRPSLSTSWINGHVRRLTYWPTRLPNATLQALTA